jgi:uncharacterized protein with HEPN domain
MKNNKQGDEFYIRSLYEEIEKAESFVKNETYETFMKDEKLQYAVYKACENIGEAVKNLSNDLKNKYPGIPWKIIVGFRNVLAHEYFGVEIQRTWNTVQKDIPDIKGKVEQIIKTFEKPKNH